MSRLTPKRYQISQNAVMQNQLDTTVYVPPPSPATVPTMTETTCLRLGPGANCPPGTYLRAVGPFREPLITRTCCTQPGYIFRIRPCTTANERTVATVQDFEGKLWYLCQSFRLTIPMPQFPARPWLSRPQFPRPWFQRTQFPRPQFPIRYPQRMQTQTFTYPADALADPCVRSCVQANGGGTSWIGPCWDCCNRDPACKYKDAVRARNQQITQRPYAPLRAAPPAPSEGEWWQRCYDACVKGGQDPYKCNQACLSALRDISARAPSSSVRFGDGIRARMPISAATTTTIVNANKLSKYQYLR